MSKWLFATAAALASLSAPSIAAASAPTTVASKSQSGSPAWLEGGRLSTGGAALVALLDRATIDNMASGPALAARARSLVDRAATGDADAAEEASSLLSSAWVSYVQAIDGPVAGMDYADPSAKPAVRNADTILADALASPSLADHVRQVSAVNPVYEAVRRAAIESGQADDPRVADTLARLRGIDAKDRTIVVDSRSAMLWMIENGKIAGTMKVITGDADNETPMIASVIRDATYNPYWNVPGDVARESIAPRVAEQGIAYLTERNYEVFESYAADARKIDPASVDWAKVAAGDVNVRLRRGPGEWNSMGKVKFAFANDHDIYLHDTPTKDLFAKADRNLSHGCVRLEDAERLARWMFNGQLPERSSSPELAVALPKAVPIYITRLDARLDNGRLALLDAPATTGGVRIATGR